MLTAHDRTGKLPKLGVPLLNHKPLSLQVSAAVFTSPYGNWAQWTRTNAHSPTAATAANYRVIFLWVMSLLSPASTQDRLTSELGREKKPQTLHTFWQKPKILVIVILKRKILLSTKRPVAWFFRSRVIQLPCFKHYVLGVISNIFYSSNQIMSTHTYYLLYF